VIPDFAPNTPATGNAVSKGTTNFVNPLGGSPPAISEEGSPTSLSLSLPFPLGSSPAEFSPIGSAISEKATSWEKLQSDATPSTATLSAAERSNAEDAVGKTRQLPASPARSPATQLAAPFPLIALASETSPANHLDNSSLAGLSPVAAGTTATDPVNSPVTPASAPLTSPAKLPSIDVEATPLRAEAMLTPMAQSASTRVPLRGEGVNPQKIRSAALANIDVAGLKPSIELKPRPEPQSASSSQDSASAPPPSDAAESVESQPTAATVLAQDIATLVPWQASAPANLNDQAGQGNSAETGSVVGRAGSRNSTSSKVVETTSGVTKLKSLFPADSVAPVAHASSLDIAGGAPNTDITSRAPSFATNGEKQQVATPADGMTPEVRKLASEAAQADPTPTSPALLSNVQMARLTDHACQSEMQIDLRMTSFGNVQVHAVVRDSQVGLVVASERGDLQRLLAPEFSGLQAGFRQHDLQLESIRFVEGGAGLGAGLSGGSDSQSQSRWSEQRPGQTLPNPFFSGTVSHSGERDAEPQRSRGLSVHA
jgi:hypothetical protein